jgi:hypothetical protein
MLIAGTKSNKALAGAVNARVAADASIVAAKAWAIRLGAIGMAGLLIGAGVGLAFLGVAQSRDASGAAERLADTLTKAIERSTLHAELDPASTVKLDPAAQVAMDPNATVKMADPQPMPHPTRDQLKPDATAPSKHAVQTNYTVFKTVRFGPGQVVTGYTFAPDGNIPNHQYCYFADGIDKQSYKTLHIAAEGHYIAPPDPTSGVDPAKAAAECVWFDGKPTRF